MNDDALMESHVTLVIIGIPKQHHNLSNAEDSVRKSGIPWVGIWMYSTRLHAQVNSFASPIQLCI